MSRLQPSDNVKLLFYGALVALAFAALAWQLARRPDAPLRYTQAEYAPARAVYAPGENMVYSPTLVIQEPGRVTVFRSYWNRDKDANATLCSGGPAPTIEVSRNFPPSAVGNVRGGSRVQLIVPPLPPGNYWLLSSASGPGGGQTMYQVPFSIRKNC